MKTKDIFQPGNLLEKKEILDNTILALKREFIGLDRVINELEGLVTPWLLFPEAQLRPTVINLWGLTGSGKTALIQRFVDLLQARNRYVQLDMGEYESDSSSWIKSIFTDDLEHLHLKPSIICMDEFQFARTIDEDGKEMGKDKLRVIWEMLDTGKINYTPRGNSYYFRKGETCLMNLLRCLEKGVRVENGKVLGGEEIFAQAMKDFYFEDEGRYGAAMNGEYMLGRDFVSGVYFLFNDDVITRETVESTIKASDLDGIIDLVMEGLKTRLATKQLDLSKALVFVVGNLDEAYYMSRSMNPDISADDLHKTTLKITTSQIKNSLKKRFRNEQIARLGNNHIIYTSFTNADYLELINRNLEKIKEYVQMNYSFEILFDPSVSEIIYKEGVFPAQGTRPVFTTIKNLVESNIAKLLLEKMRKQLDVKFVEWKFSGEKFVFIFKDALNTVLNIYETPVLLKVEGLRKSTNSDVQAHTAVHEAGHAIMAALTLRILPTVVVSKTADANSDGFCLVNHPEGMETRESLKKDIMISLAGWIAEKMIFGEENTSSGVQTDLEQATAVAHRIIKLYGMGSDPVAVSVLKNNNNLEFIHTSQHTNEAMEIIRDCKLSAEQLLLRNKYLLLKMAEHLCTNSRMETEEIKKFVLDYSAEEWVGKEEFKTKENYFSFREVISVQLGEMENVTGKE
jgi:hypothetical protein